MTIYITQGRYTEQAVKGFLQHPENRADTARKLVEAGGGKMLHYFVTLGEFDFMVISEADADHFTNLMGTLMIAASTGGVTGLKTTVAMSTQDAVKAMESGRAIIAGLSGAFKPAGG